MSDRDSAHVSAIRERMRRWRHGARRRCRSPTAGGAGRLGRRRRHRRRPRRRRRAHRRRAGRGRTTRRRSTRRAAAAPAGLGSSAPSVARWLGDIRRYFPTPVVQVLQRDAIDRLDLRQLLLEPEMLRAVEPDLHLVTLLVELNRAAARHDPGDGSSGGRTGRRADRAATRAAHPAGRSRRAGARQRRTRRPRPPTSTGATRSTPTCATTCPSSARSSPNVCRVRTSPAQPAARRDRRHRPERVAWPTASSTPRCSARARLDALRCAPPWSPSTRASSISRRAGRSGRRAVRCATRRRHRHRQRVGVLPVAVTRPADTVLILVSDLLRGRRCGMRSSPAWRELVTQHGVSVRRAAGVVRRGRAGVRPRPRRRAGERSGCRPSPARRTRSPTCWPPPSSDATSPVGRPAPASSRWRRRPSDRRLRADLELAERRGRVDAGVLRQTEHTLADDVAHHLVGAARRCACRGCRGSAGPRVRAPLAGVGDELRAEDAGRRSRRGGACCVPASLAIDISGPGSWPARILSIARWLVYWRPWCG